MPDIKLPHDHGCNTNCKEILKNMPDSEVVEKVAEAMKMLGDPSRLRIFWLLCHCEECVADIAAMVDMTSPAVSHHLRQLKASGLIVSHRSGKEMLYTASDQILAQTLHLTIEQLGDITCPEKHIHTED